MTDVDRLRLEYHVVDVFTDRPFAGNPLAIVLGGESLTTVQMQRLAEQFHLSETAFPLFPPDVDGADYQLRIFTPEVELPFAGHPSVGTAWLLRSLGRLELGTARQSCGAGVLALQVSEDSATVSGGEPMLADVADRDAALAAVGLGASDLSGPPVKVASVGLPYVVLPVHVSALSRCEGDLKLLRGFFGLPNELTGVYVVAWEDAVANVAARMFASDIGAVEDPATGSAALAFGVYAAGQGLIPDGVTTINISQGVQLGRPSKLRVDVEVQDGAVFHTQVTGKVAPVATGTIEVPPL